MAKFLRKPLVIVGPSGVGKGTITDLLLQEYPQHFSKCVSHTTRAPRKGEEHGREYFFTKKESMVHQIEQGGFLEHAVVHGNIYGTSWEALKDVDASGRIGVLDIDVFGLRQIIAATDPESLNRVGILPPNMEELEIRLRHRGSESEKSLQTRLFAAKEEARSIREDGIVDVIIENNDSWKIGYP